MYAVIATGGKQYRVEKGGVLRVEKLAAEPGATVEFNEVLLVRTATRSLGQPLLAGGKVHGDGREARSRADKVTDRQIPPAQALSAAKTHRQQYTQVRVTDISAP